MSYYHLLSSVRELFRGYLIELSLRLIQLTSILITHTSMNSTRSLGMAWFAGHEALEQAWLFLVAAVTGVVIAGLSNYVLFSDHKALIPVVDHTAG